MGTNFYTGGPVEVHIYSKVINVKTLPEEVISHLGFNLIPNRVFQVNIDERD